MQDKSMYIFNIPKWFSREAEYQKDWKTLII